LSTLPPNRKARNSQIGSELGNQLIVEHEVAFGLELVIALECVDESSPNHPGVLLGGHNEQDAPVCELKWLSRA
jgi:hypothetical protein